MVKRICEISNKILKCASSGLTRLDFIRGVAVIFCDFAKADAVTIYLGDRERLNSFSYGLNKEFSYKAERKSTTPLHLFNENTLLSANHSEFIQWLNGFFCRYINKNKVSLTEEYNDGSVCLYTQNLTNGTKDIEYKSHYLIPVVFDEGNFVIINIKHKKDNAFKRADIIFFAKISQVLSDGFSHQFAQDALRERVKELTCLYQITQIANKPNYTISQIMQLIAELLPSAMQYPNIANARIYVDNEYYLSRNFKESKIKLSSPINTQFEQRGFLDIFYNERKLPTYGQIFLQEEENLIEAVSKQIALIIERKQIEEMNTKLQEQLRHADRLATIGQLSAGIAHEINEPLGTILGFAQLIETDENTPQQTIQDIKKIINAALHGREVIRKLMLFSRQMPPQKGRVNINRVIEEGLYFLESRCFKSGIEIIKELHPNIPEIDADPNQIHQILVNLVVNAIHAMPEGGKLTLATNKNNDKTLSFKVIDTGKGIPDEIQQKIFIPFFTTKDINEGTGLGLSVVHGIVASHNGKINVISSKDKGTTFEIRLPYE